jgi:hypothetical protein
VSKGWILGNMANHGPGAVTFAHALETRAETKVGTTRDAVETLLAREGRRNECSARMNMSADATRTDNRIGALHDENVVARP